MDILVLTRTMNLSVAEVVLITTAMLMVATGTIGEKKQERLIESVEAIVDPLLPRLTIEISKRHILHNDDHLEENNYEKKRNIMTKKAWWEVHH